MNAPSRECSRKARMGRFFVLPLSLCVRGAGQRFLAFARNLPPAASRRTFATPSLNSSSWIPYNREQRVYWRVALRTTQLLKDTYPTLTALLATPLVFSQAPKRTTYGQLEGTSRGTIPGPPTATPLLLVVLVEYH
jgi:hypothetical protein